MADPKKTAAAAATTNGVTEAAAKKSQLDGLGLDADYQDVNLESFFWRAKMAQTPVVGGVVGIEEDIPTKHGTMNCLIVRLSKEARWLEKAGGPEIIAPDGSNIRVPSNNSQLKEVERQARLALSHGKVMGIALAVTGTTMTPKGERNDYEFRRQPIEKWADLKQFAPEMVNFGSGFDVEVLEAGAPAPKQLAAAPNGAATAQA